MRTLLSPIGLSMLLALAIPLSSKAQTNTGYGVYIPAIEFGYREGYAGPFGEYFYYSSQGQLNRDGVTFFQNLYGYMGHRYMGLNGYDRFYGGKAYMIGAAIFRLADIPDRDFQKLILSPKAVWAGSGVGPVSLFMRQSDGVLRTSSFQDWLTPIASGNVVRNENSGWYTLNTTGANYLGDTLIDITSALDSARLNSWDYVAIGVYPDPGNGVLTITPQIVSADFDITATGVPEPSTYALLLMSAAGALWWAKRRR